MPPGGPAGVAAHVEPAQHASLPVGRQVHRQHEQADGGDHQTSRCGWSPTRMHGSASRTAISRPRPAMRCARRVELFGKRITVAETHTHQYVTAIIKVRTRRVIVITLDGEIIHDGDYHLSRVLR